MKHLKKAQYIADQSNVIVKKSQKHDVNLQKNSTLYFQVGLIVCLLAVFSLFEMEFEKTTYHTQKLTTPVEPSLFAMDKFKIYEDVQAEKQVTKKKQKILSIDPIIKPDDFEIKKQIELLTEAKITNKITDIDDIKIIDKPIDEDEIFNMIDVEKVPIYPGCESAKTNDKRKKCMSEKITQLIQKKFNTDIASELGLVGIQKINVQFKIDKKGNITDIKTRAPFSQLEDEALRVVEKIPVMKPGLQRGQPVSVLYNLPIVFKVQ